LNKENETVVDKCKKMGIITWSIIGLVLLFFGVFSFLVRVKGVLYLFLLAFFIVYILRPIVDYFEQKGLSRILSIIFAYVLLLFFIVLISFLFVPVIITQIRSLAYHAPSYFKSVQGFVESYQNRFEVLRLPPAAIDFIENSLTQITDAAIKTATRLPTYTMNVFSFAANLIVVPIFAIVISFYMLKDLGAIKETAIGLIPVKYQNEVKLLVYKIDAILKGFLKGQVSLVLVTGTLSWLALLFLGVDYAFTLGAIIGLFDIVPYFGPIVGGALAVIVALFKSPITALWVVVAMVIVQQIEAVFVSPNLMGKQVNLHPLAIIFAMLIGGTLFGIFGIILAIPIAAVGKGVFYYYLEKRESQKT